MQQLFSFVACHCDEDPQNCSEIMFIYSVLSHRKNQSDMPGLLQVMEAYTVRRTAIPVLHISCEQRIKLNYEIRAIMLKCRETRRS